MSIRPLSDALRRKAEEEINESPTTVAENLRILRDWLSEQPHLRSVNPTDQWLAAFLRGCKHNIEKAQRKIEVYYTLKSTVPEFYANRDPLDPGIQEILKAGAILPLKKCIAEDSPSIIVTRAGAFCQTSRPLSELIKVSFMILEILLLENDNFCISGEDMIVDASDVTFSLVWQWTPAMAKKLITCVENALSIRIKGMHILNGPFFLAPALKLFKMFLGAKLKSRIQSHTKGLETLYDYFDKSVLPKEYGGTEGTVQELIDYWKAKVESKRDWFLEDNVCSSINESTCTHNYICDNKLNETNRPFDYIDQLD